MVKARTNNAPPASETADATGLTSPKIFSGEMIAVMAPRSTPIPSCARRSRRAASAALRRLSYVGISTASSPTESAATQAAARPTARTTTIVAASANPCRTPRRSSAPTMGQAVRAMKRPNITGTTSDATSRRASTATRTSTSPPIAASGPADRISPSARGPIGAAILRRHRRPLVLCSALASRPP